METEVEELLSQSPQQIRWKYWSRELSREERRVIDLFRGPIKREFQDNGLLVAIFVQPVDSEHAIWGDFGWDSLIDEYGWDVLDGSLVIFELKVDRYAQTFTPFLHTGLYLQHNFESDADKRKMVQILRKYLGEYFQWDGSTDKAMLIKS